MPTLLLFLGDGPFHNESVDHTYQLAKAALSKGHLVNIFLMMDGVYNALTSQNGEPFKMPSVAEQFTELIQAGANITGCHVCMSLRGVQDTNVPVGYTAGGLADLNDMAMESDVLVHFLRRG